MNDYIKIKGVSKSYRRGNYAVPVLRDLSLSITKGSFVALMGPSGSGKTTLLNLISGLDTVTSGEIVIGDVPISRLSAGELSTWRSRHVGFVFQFYNLLPMLSAERNVELPLLLTQLTAAQRAHHVGTALELVGLSDRRKHMPDELSGGQMQRVAIARALVADSDVLVCDEPTGDLDRATADEILSLLQLVSNKHGKTVVMVTHDDKAAAYAQDVYHMDKGVLISGNLVLQAAA